MEIRPPSAWPQRACADSPTTPVRPEAQAIQPRPRVRAAAPHEQPTPVLAPAQAVLAAMPEVDEARIMALRDALASGDVPFEPARLADLILRFHGRRT